MRTLSNYRTGVLNQLKNHFPNITFNHVLTQADVELFDTFCNESPVDIFDMFDQSQNCTWYLTFVDNTNNKHYMIIADGELTSNGNYYLAEIIEELVLEENNSL